MKILEDPVEFLHNKYCQVIFQLEQGCCDFLYCRFLRQAPHRDALASGESCDRIGVWLLGGKRNKPASVKSDRLLIHV